jgi:sugar porter (SP) family MFS transporter
LICIEGGIIAFGTLIAYWIDFGASYGTDNFSWRFPIAFQIVFALIVMFFMVWLPESPRFLLTKDRNEESLHVIAALRGLEVHDPETQLQARIIVDSIRASGHHGGKTPFKSLITGGPTQHFRRMLLGSSSQFMQQIGGCNATIYYSTILFNKSIGLDDKLSLIMGGVNMVVYAIFATVSWFIIERVGRRKLFLGGTFGQALSMTIIFACLIPGTAETAKGAAVGIFLYLAFFGATWLPLPWLYPAEINPIKTRAKANAVSTCTNWLWNFFVVMITPIMIDNIGWGTYLFFAVVNLCFIPFIYIYYPETRGRSLEEIDLIFAKGYKENISYVRASKEMPFYSDEEIDAKAREYGFGSDEEAAAAGSGAEEKSEKGTELVEGATN